MTLLLIATIGFFNFVTAEDIIWVQAFNSEQNCHQACDLIGQYCHGSEKWPSSLTAFNDILSRTVNLGSCKTYSDLSTCGRSTCPNGVFTHVGYTGLPFGGVSDCYYDPSGNPAPCKGIFVGSPYRRFCPCGEIPDPTSLNDVVPNNSSAKDNKKNEYAKSTKKTKKKGRNG